MPRKRSFATFRAFCVTLICTTAGPCFATRSAKSGSAAALAAAGAAPTTADCVTAAPAGVIVAALLGGDGADGERAGDRHGNQTALECLRLHRSLLRKWHSIAGDTPDATQGRSEDLSRN